MIPSSTPPPANRIDARLMLDAVTNQGGQTKSSPTSITGDQFSAGKTDQLNRLIESESEIRPEILERGQALAKDASYPSRELVRHISDVIVSSPDESSQ